MADALLPTILLEQSKAALLLRNECVHSVDVFVKGEDEFVGASMSNQSAQSYMFPDQIVKRLTS
jgi:hypothetical protein